MRTRPRPPPRAVFLTLEDEFGHAPFMAWPKVYERYKQALKASLVIATGTVSRREGTMNVVLESARALPVIAELPKSHDFR